MMFNLKGKHCVIIGGGTVATRKAKLLLKYDCKIEVISSKVSEDLIKLENEKRIHLILQDYFPGIIPECFILFSATNNFDLNRLIALEARSKNIFVNIVDNSDESDFIVPATHISGDLTLSVSTNGKSPLLAKKIKDELVLSYDKKYSYLLDLLGELRLLALRTIKEEDRRKELYEEILNSEVFEVIKSNNIDLAKDIAYNIYNKYYTEEQTGVS